MCMHYNLIETDCICCILDSTVTYSHHINVLSMQMLLEMSQYISEI